MPSFAAWDIFQSYAVIDAGNGNLFRAGGINADLADSFSGTYFGHFKTTDTFLLDGGELKTYKNGSSNVCGGNILYRVYKSCETPGSFSAISLAFESNLGGGDQRWQTLGSAVNLLSGLSDGDYMLEVWFEALGSDANPSGCDYYKYDSNSGSNFIANFSVGDEAFADGDFTSGPTWSGDTGSYSVLDPTSLSSDGSNANINGTYAINGDVLVSNASASDAALITASAQAYGTWEFSVATGLNWDLSATNNFAVILVSDSNDPTKLTIGSMDFNGYFVKWSNNGATDTFGLFKQEGTTETLLVDMGWPLADNAYSGYSLRVSRNAAGEWFMYGAAGFDTATAMTYYGTAADNDVTTSSYFAVSSNITNPSAARRLFFDNLMIRPLTEVNFSVASGSVTEDDTDITYTLTVNISNPDDRCATTVDVALASGTASRIGSYTTQSLTFPAGSSASQTVSVTVSGNTTCERNEDFVFELENIAGGNGAELGGGFTHNMSLNDDESGTELWFSEDFEDGNADGWMNTSAWTVISSGATLSGTYDLRHNTNVAAVNDYISHSLNNLFLTGAETNWRFNIRNGGFETTANNWLMVVIAGSESDAFSASMDGYAVGVNFNSATDNLRLVRVDGGVFTDLITSSYDWNAPSITLGIEVIRDAGGLWSFNYKENGGFSGMTSGGTPVTDATYVTANYLSLACELTSSNTGSIRFDDLTVAQYGCYSDWYSVDSGDASSPIWAQTTSGTGINAEFSRFNNFTIQAGDAVVLDLEATVRNFTVESTASFGGGGDNLRVYENFTNDGAFDGQFGAVIFTGNQSQIVGGSSPIDFGFLRINNSSAGGVVFEVDATVSGVVFPDFGTADVTGYEFRLLSSVLGTASIAAFNDNSDWIGDVTMERWIPSAAGNGWVNFSSGLTGLTLEDWNDNIVSTGFTGSDYPLAQTFEGGIFNNMQRYDETAVGGLNDGWTGATDITNTIDPNYGYMIYMLPGSQLIDVTGGLQIGDINQNLSYNTSGTNANDGWHLVTNPYPSDIDWDAVVAASTGVSSYYVYDFDTNSQLTRNGNTGIGSASQYIASSQSFFVKVDATGGSLNWSEGVKTQIGADFERNEEVAGLINILATSGTVSNNAFIGFYPGATAYYENEFDAYYNGGNAFGANSIGVVTLDPNNQELSINTLCVLTEAVSVPVRLFSLTSTTVTLEIAELSGIAAGSCVSIEDTETGVIEALTEGYTCTADLTENTPVDRYVIHFSAPVAAAVTPMSCYEADDAAIALTTPDNGEWSVVWYDEMDMVIAESTTTLQNLAMGTYTAVLSNNNLVCEAVSVQVIIDNAQQQSAAVTSEYSACDIDDIGEIAIETMNTESFNYVLSLDGAVIAEGVSTEADLVLEQLAAGMYTLDISSVCLTETHEINLFDPNGVQVSVTPVTAELIDGEASFTLVANSDNATQYTWSQNGVEIGTGSSLNQTVTEAGTYSYTVWASNDVCAGSTDVDVLVSETDNVSDINAAAATFINIENGFGLILTENLQNAEVRVFDVAGKLVDRTRVNGTIGRQDFTFENLTTGAYVVRLSAAGNQLATTRFVK